METMGCKGAAGRGAVWAEMKWTGQAVGDGKGADVAGRDWTGCKGEDGR